MEEDMSVNLVGMIKRDQARNEIDNLVDVMRHAGFEFWRQNAKCGHIIMVGINIAFCDDRNRLTSFLSRRVDLVIDIREVSRVDNSIESLPEKSIQDIKNNGWSSITCLLYTSDAADE